MNNPNLTIVIPAYNEESTIGNVVAKISNIQYPISNVRTIVVDDGSSDRTAEVARDAGALVLRHHINRGLGAALATGLEATFRLYKAKLCTAVQSLAFIVVTLDADGQHDPAEIPRLIEPILKGEAEVVIGSRFHNKSLALSRPTKLSFDQSQIPWHRLVANFCGNLFTWLLFGIWVSDSQSGFRAFRADAAARLRLRTSTMEVSSEIIREIARLKLKVAEVPITARYTTYSLSKGQSFLRGLETLWKLIVLRFFR